MFGKLRRKATAHREAKALARAIARAADRQRREAQLARERRSRKAEARTNE